MRRVSTLLLVLFGFSLGAMQTACGEALAQSGTGAGAALPINGGCAPGQTCRAKAFIAGVTANNARAFSQVNDTHFCVNAPSCSRYWSYVGATDALTTNAQMHATRFAVLETAGVGLRMPTGVQLDLGDGTFDHLLSVSGTITTPGRFRADQIFASAAADFNAVAIDTNGARLDLGSGANDHLSSDGAKILTPGNIEANAIQTNTTIYYSNALPTCSSSLEGSIYRLSGTGGLSSGTRTRMCLCTSNGGGGYDWQNVVTGVVGTSLTCVQ